MLFIFKKIASSLVTIPGIVIMIHVVMGVLFLRRKQKTAGVFCLLMGVLLYTISIPLTGNGILSLVESENVYHPEKNIDVIILLGGGVVEGVDDLSGKDSIPPDAMSRVVDAVRIYAMSRKPIIISGGSPGSEQHESGLMGRFLKDLGVPGKDIILERKSRDTGENADYVKKIFIDKGYKRGVLVTSAYHVKRSKMIFKKAGIDVVPHASGKMGEIKKRIHYDDLLPGVYSLKKTAVSLRELLGYIYYYYLSSPLRQGGSE